MNVKIIFFPVIYLIPYFLKSHEVENPTILVHQAGYNKSINHSQNAADYDLGHQHV